MMKSAVRSSNFRLSWTTLALVGAAALAVILSGCPRTLSYSDPLPNQQTALKIRKSINQGGSGGGVAAGPQPKGWATIRGVIKVSGPTPTPSPIDAVSKDNCGVVLNTSLIVNPQNQGLQHVIVFLSDGLMKNDLDQPNPIWINPEYRITDDSRIQEFDQKDCVFIDRSAAVHIGQTLRVLNSDPFNHNTDIKDRKNTVVPPGSFDDWEVSKPGRDPVSVSCAIHPWMRSNLLISENPYYAVTDENGRFEIKNVPSDVELEFRVWHERSGYVPEATVDGQSEKWSKGKFTRTFTNGEDVELNIELSNSLF